VDDQEMKLRYLVIDTGNWLPGKKVVAPEYKPDADFSRDYETRLHDYYRFPYYWM
jgi:hypothetical protein